MNKQITEYLSKNKDSFSKDTLVNELKKAGYLENDIQEGADFIYGSHNNNTTSADKTSPSVMKLSKFMPLSIMGILFLSFMCHFIPYAAFILAMFFGISYILLFLNKQRKHVMIIINVIIWIIYGMFQNRVVEEMAGETAPIRIDIVIFGPILVLVSILGLISISRNYNKFFQFNNLSKTKILLSIIAIIALINGLHSWDAHSVSQRVKDDLYSISAPSKSELIKIAEQYLLEKPELFDLQKEEYISWNESEIGNFLDKENFSEGTLERLTQYRIKTVSSDYNLPEEFLEGEEKISVRYIEPNDYSIRFGKDNKYEVGWQDVFYCEKAEAERKPCTPVYLDIIINKEDLTVERAEFRHFQSKY